jgi:hypothetical protein
MVILAAERESWGSLKWGQCQSHGAEGRYVCIACIANHFVGCCTYTVHCVHNLNNVQTALMILLLGQLLRSVNSGCTYAVHCMHNLNHVHKALIQCIVYII